MAQGRFEVPEVISGILEFAPRLLLAAGLLLTGWLLARLLRGVAVRLMRGISNRVVGRLGRLFRGQDAETQLRRSGLAGPLGDAAGNIVFWVVVIISLAAATESLGFPVVSVWLSGIAVWLPRLLAGIVIVVLGAVLANLLRNVLALAASRADLPYAEALGRIAQVVVMTAAVLVAIDEIGVEITFLTVLLATVVGTLLAGAALAFGLGAQTEVGNIIASHYLGKQYRVGQQVRIGGLQGRIAEITPTAVVLTTSDGRVSVPAREFSEKASTLLSGEALED